jgi:hypothetical protein
MHLPTRVHTVGDLLAHHHTLGLYCCQCDRWTEAPLERLAREGWARTPIVKLRFRCAVCDGPAQRQLRPPPMQSPHAGTAWIQPATQRSTSTSQQRPAAQP